MQVVQVLECVFITPDSLLAHYRLTVGSLLVAIGSIARVLYAVDGLSCGFEAFCPLVTRFLPRVSPSKW